LTACHCIDLSVFQVRLAVCRDVRQTLRDWVLRYNAEGVAGLCNRIAAGPKPRLTPEQEALVAELVRKGPDPAVDRVVRWRRVDLARVIKTRFNVIVAERGVGAMLRRLGFRRLSVRPRHPQQDPAAQEAHKKTSPIWLKPQSPSMPGKNIRRAASCGSQATSVCFPCRPIRPS
jgi:transposase